MCPYHDAGGYDRQPDSRDGEPPASPPRLGAITDGKPPRSAVQINIHPRVAGCGCFMLAALAMLIGCGLLLIVVWGVLIPDWRTNNSYLQASAIVLDKRLDSQLFDVVNPKGRPVKQQERFKPEIKIRYEIEGRTFELWTYDGGSTYFDRDSQQAIIDSFVAGEKYPCWYDPDCPDQAVLVRSRSWGAYVFLILPIGFLVVGAAGFVIAWKIASLPPRQVDGDRRALAS